MSARRKAHLAYDAGEHPCVHARRCAPPRRRTAAALSAVECKICLAYVHRWPQLRNKLRCAELGVSS